jgi:hypothetical protein
VTPREKVAAIIKLSPRPVSIAEIVGHTGLQRQAVGRYLNELLDLGESKPSGFGTQPARGMSPILWTVRAGSRNFRG